MVIISIEVINMNIETNINIKHTILGWTCLGLILFVIIAMLDAGVVGMDVFYIPILAGFCILYMVFSIYIQSGILEIGNDVGNYIITTIRGRF